jgi:hypothetical protein
MHNFLRLRWLGVVLVAVALAACAPAKVRNVTDQPVRTNKSPVTMQDVGAAIKRAGAGLGWAMLDAGPGKIDGTLRLRTHVAEVVVSYDTAKFSIDYKNSVNLDYDAQKGTIHKNYNGWIQNLDNAIQRELANMP